MKKYIFFLVFLFFSSYLYAEELIDKFIIEMNSKVYFEYESNAKEIKSNSNWDYFETYKEEKIYSIIKFIPNDTIVGFCYNVKNDYDSTVSIYNGTEFFDYNYKSATIKKIKYENKDINPIGFRKEQNTFKTIFFMKDFYRYSLFKIIKELKSLTPNRTITKLSDSIEYGIEVNRIVIDLCDTIKHIDRDKPWINTNYYFLSFDKKTNLLISWTIKEDYHLTQVHFYNYNFSPKNDEEYFSRKAVPKDYVIEIDSSIIRKIKNENVFGGITFDYSITHTQNSFYIGYNKTGNIQSDGFTRWNMQMNIFGGDWMYYDIYNRKYSRSGIVSSISASWFTVTGLSLAFAQLGGVISQEEAGYYKYICYAPCMLTNTQYGYILSQSNDYHYYGYSTSSIYFKTKIDYFSENPIKYWRFKPGIGYEISLTSRSQALDDPRRYIDFIPFGLGFFLDIGIEYPIDFIEHNRPNFIGFKPSMSMRLAIGG